MLLAQIIKLISAARISRRWTVGCRRFAFDELILWTIVVFTGFTWSEDVRPALHGNALL